jgi:hypothetical protein
LRWQKDPFTTGLSSYARGLLFEMYATGNYSLLKLPEEAEKFGLRTRKGKKVAKSQKKALHLLQLHKC